MSAANRVLKNTLFLYGKIAVTSVCLILSTRYVLKGLGVEDFGVYNLICSTIVMLGFLNDSMTAATQRFMSYAEGEGKFDKSIKIFNTSYTVHIIIALVVASLFIILTPVVFGSYLQIPDERRTAAMMVYFFMILSTGLNMITVPYNATLIAHENMLYFSLVGILNGLLKLAVAIGVIYVPYDRLVAYGFLMLLIAFFDIAVVRIYCHIKYKECKISLRKHTDKAILKEMLSFAGWQMTYSASSILSIQGMSLILNSFYGTIMNAAQGIARQVCGQMMTLCSTMMSALNPVIVKKAGAHDLEAMVRTVMIGSKLSYSLVILVALPLLFELPFLLKVWLTEVPDYAIQFCQWEIIQQIIASFTMALVTMISGVGDIRGLQLMSAIVYVVRLPLIFIVLFFGGVPVTAYYIATFAVVALCIGRIYYAHKKCNLPIMEYLRTVILPCLIVTSLISIALYIVNISVVAGWNRLILTLLVSVSVFALTIYSIALNLSEREMIRNTVLKAIKNDRYKR